MADLERTAKPASADRSSASADGSPSQSRGETLFWKRRLKRAEHGADGSLPYGDLMSLLLAVFVMIAAMSELKGNAHYRKVAGGVQHAFGFSVADARPRLDPLREAASPRTLQERLERIDWDGGLPVRISDGTGRPLAPCRMWSEPGRVVFRIPVQACFQDIGTVLEPPAERLLAVLTGYLADGEAFLDIRLHAGPASLPPEAMLRDACDLAYERGRALSGALISGGVAPSRIALVVSGEGLRNDRVEIIVRTAPAALENGTFADGERDDHG